jgi:hypothetical protein
VHDCIALRTSLGRGLVAPLGVFAASTSAFSFSSFSFFGIPHFSSAAATLFTALACMTLLRRNACGV